MLRQMVYTRERSLMSVKQLVVRSTAPLYVVFLLLSCFIFSSLVGDGGSSAAFAKSRETSDHTLIMQLDAPEEDALRAVQAVVNDQIVHGTQQYAKEKILFGAHAAQSSRALDHPEIGGKVFYKEADKILAPQNFRDSESMGTITVRYIVHGVSATASTIQIDAVFVDDD